MWFVLIVMLFGSMALILVGWQGWQERLPRQHWAGIRTPYAMANDEQWKLVHRYGSPYMIFGGVAVFAGALALLPFAIAGVLPEAFTGAAVMGFCIILLVSALASWQKGVSGAKSALSR